MKLLNFAEESNSAKYDDLFSKGSKIKKVLILRLLKLRSPMAPIFRLKLSAMLSQLFKKA